MKSLTELHQLQDYLRNDEEFDDPTWFKHWYIILYKIGIAEGKTHKEIVEDFREKTSEIIKKEDEILYIMDQKEFKEKNDEDFKSVCEHDLKMWLLEKIAIATVLNERNPLNK